MNPHNINVAKSAFWLKTGAISDTELLLRFLITSRGPSFARQSEIRLAFVRQFFCRCSFMKKAEEVPISLFGLNRMTNNAEKSKKVRGSNPWGGLCVVLFNTILPLRKKAWPLSQTNYKGGFTNGMFSCTHG